MVKIFSRYVSVGVINTLIHWLVFTLCLWLTKCDQMVANFVAFIIAVTFSFFANARWTFKASSSFIRYIAFVTFMGLLAISIGFMADRMQLLPIFTMIIFSFLSLIIGFIYSNFFIFKEGK